MFYFARGRASLYFNRFLLSFLNEEQMPAAWLSDWDVACPETFCFRPEELLWAARTTQCRSCVVLLRAAARAFDTT